MFCKRFLHQLKHMTGDASIETFDYTNHSKRFCMRRTFSIAKLEVARQKGRYGFNAA